MHTGETGTVVITRSRSDAGGHTCCRFRRKSSKFGA